MHLLSFFNTPGFTRGWRCSSPSGLPGERIAVFKLGINTASFVFFAFRTACHSDYSFMPVMRSAILPFSVLPLRLAGLKDSASKILGLSQN
jgi:hypothetical protein